MADIARIFDIAKKYDLKNMMQNKYTIYVHCQKIYNLFVQA